MTSTATYQVTGFFTQSSGNIVSVVGKLMWRYVIQGVLPMLAVDTPDGTMHVAEEDAQVSKVVEPKATKSARYTTGHPGTGETVEIHHVRRNGVKWITWIRFDVTGLSEEKSADLNYGGWVQLGTSSASTYRKALSAGKSTNPYGAEYTATEAIDNQAL